MMNLVIGVVTLWVLLHWFFQGVGRKYKFVPAGLQYEEIDKG